MALMTYVGNMSRETSPCRMATPPVHVSRECERQGTSCSACRHERRASRPRNFTRSSPRTCSTRCRGIPSCHAGTGVCVVKMQRRRTLSMSRAFTRPAKLWSNAARANLGQVTKNGPRSCGNLRMLVYNLGQEFHSTEAENRFPGTAGTFDRLRRESSSTRDLRERFQGDWYRADRRGRCPTNSPHGVFQARTTTGRCSISIVIRPSTG